MLLVPPMASWIAILSFKPTSDVWKKLLPSLSWWRKISSQSSLSLVKHITHVPSKSSWTQKHFCQSLIASSFLVKQVLACEVATETRVASEGMELHYLGRLLSKYHADLKSHLHSSPKNVSYLSPKVQNEFIKINGDLIWQSRVKECNAYWSVMAEEPKVYQEPRSSVCVFVMLGRQAQGKLMFAKNF